MTSLCRDEHTQVRTRQGARRNPVYSTHLFSALVCAYPSATACAAATTTAKRTVSSMSENKGLMNGRRKEEEDEGPCGPKNPCGRHLWTPFNVMSTLVMLGGLAAFVMGFFEWATTDRITYITAYRNFAIALICLNGVAFILGIVFASLNYPIQRTEKPERHQYAAVMHVFATGLVVSVLYIAWIGTFMNKIPTVVFDQLNTVSSDTTLVTQTVLGSRWQTALGVFGLMWLMPVFAWYNHVMAECAPLRGKSTSAPAAASSRGSVNGNGV